MTDRAYIRITATCVALSLLVLGWMAVRQGDERYTAPCSDSPIDCAVRVAATRCGGPDTFVLLSEKYAASDAPEFKFVCVERARAKVRPAETI